MCEAFVSGKVRKGCHFHKMVARSISARLAVFGSSVPVLPLTEGTASSTTSAEHFLTVYPCNESRRCGRPAMSFEDERCSESIEELAKIWERSRIESAENVFWGVRTTDFKGSKWAQFVKKLKSYLPKAGHHSRSCPRFQVHCQSLREKDFDDAIYGDIQRSVRHTSKATVCTVRIADSASAGEHPVQKMPIWQRRNRSPIPPIEIPNTRPSRAKTVQCSVI